MLICCISDTHGYHDSIKMPKGDILIHSGDSTNYGEEWEYKKFLTWMGNQNFTTKILINGNHEVIVSKRAWVKDFVEKHNKGFLTNLIYLENEAVEIAGLKFWGSPYTPEFFPENWAYQLRAENAKACWEQIPEGTDVVITHGPPFKILDKVKPFGRYPNENSGCPELLNAIGRIKPKLHVFGHIHHEYGWRRLANPNFAQTLFVNAATCNGRYVPVHKPVLIDTDDWSVIEE